MEVLKEREYPKNDRIAGRIDWPVDRGRKFLRRNPRHDCHVCCVHADELFQLLVQ